MPGTHRAMLAGSLNQQRFSSVHCRSTSTHKSLRTLPKTCRDYFRGKRLTRAPGFQPRSRQCYGQAAQASFFGVGAPEAVVVGLVAVVIFGPQGLAEAAKTLGQTIKAIQPTYNELLTTSQGMRSTLESSLGIDDVRRSLRSVTDFDTNSLGTSPSSASSTSQHNADGPKFSLGSTGESSSSYDSDIDAKRAKAAEMAWGGTSSTEHSNSGDNILSRYSLEELQAELEKRQQPKQQ